MSGGSMDYVHGNIEKAARYIQWELANERLRLDKGVLDDVGSYYKEHNADKPYIKSPLALKKEVVRRMEEALSTMRKAAVYARAVEWLTSGDDGYESFCIGLDEELAKVEKTGGVK